MMRKAFWHAEDIKAAIRKTGVTLSSLSLASGLCECACRAALRRPIPAANVAIAEYLGIPLCDLWPRWYDADGCRIHPVSSSQNTSRYRGGHRERRRFK